MPRLPLVAIIGRPNTGKSTLFNRLIGRRKAIESHIPGTTRDHISQRVEGDDVNYLLIDTGGMGKTDDVDFESDVFQQSQIALEQADLILFTISGREELTKDDRTIIDLLRKKRRRHVSVIIVVNKADTPELLEEASQSYHDLGIGDELVPVSASHKLGIGDLKGAIEKHLRKLHFGKEMRDEKRDLRNDESETPNPESRIPSLPRIAIIGKPNVGKSSIVNALMNEEHVKTSPLLVSPVAGTTRDAVDTAINYRDKTYILVDTAGLKKHSRRLADLEKLAMFRTIQALEESDVAVIVIDVNDGANQQDKKILRLAMDAGKGIIVLINKIDQVKGEVRKRKLTEIGMMLSFCRYARAVPCSAKTKEGLLKLFDIVDGIQAARLRRIPTRELNRWFEQTVYGKPLRNISTSKFMTQADEVPPTFVLFVKNPKAVQLSELRFLDNRFRETFGFEGTPVRWVTKEVEKKRKPH